MRADDLVLGTDRVALWHLDAGSRLPLWRQQWSSSPLGACRCVRLSTDGRLLAAAAQDSAVVRLWAVTATAPRELSPAWHPAPVEDVAWKADGSALFTRTEPGTFRIWASMVDEPDLYTLWATINCSPFGDSPTPPPSLASFWLDAPAGSDAASASVLSVFVDGSVGVATVQARFELPE